MNMKLKELLPVGSVVLLKDAKKKVVIMGIMQIKNVENGEQLAYDYMGVPYPEGYMGTETALLFNRDNIQEVFFKGYQNEERDIFVGVVQQILDSAEEQMADYQ